MLFGYTGKRPQTRVLKAKSKNTSEGVTSIERLIKKCTPFQRTATNFEICNLGAGCSSFEIIHM